MANGNGNKWFKESSLLSKVVAGVLVGVLVFLIVGVIGFGSRVYAFMAEGSRFSSEDYLREEKVQDAQIHGGYVGIDVYDSDQLYIRDALERIEGKLDDALDR